TTDPLTGLGTSGAGGTMVMDGCCDAVQEDLVLSDALLDLVDGTGTCFPRGASFTVAFAGHIEADKKTGGVLARYFFDAFDQSGSALGYEMVLLGGVSGPFPPGVGETVTIDWTSGSIGSQGKGKGKNNGCIGDLTTAVAGDTVVVTGTS
ncbi:MAG: hypothetical protein R3244_10960, partial [Thermoanaerobaculia bacterium]|nr:hypothetical protein [Thermoanaerobaculia bacterium]